MNYSKQTIFLLINLILVITSCAFNKQFLTPLNLKSKSKPIVANKTAKDSLVIRFEGENKQPIFLVNGIEPLVKNYKIESIFFKNQNNVNLNGWMIKSSEVPFNGRTIIYIHGSGGSILTQFSNMLPFVYKGYQVFAVDFSGYGFSEGEPQRQTLLKDGKATIDYVKSREDVKNTALILYGQSYGAHTAVCLAALEQSKIDLLIEEAGFSNHKQLSAVGANPFIAFMSKIFVKEFYRGSQEIKKVTIPKIIIHSETDSIIPYKMGQLLFKNAIEPKVFITAKGKHIEAPKNNLSEILDEIDKFLEK